jgi:hypothetical protein
LKYQAKTTPKTWYLTPWHSCEVASSNDQLATGWQFGAIQQTKESSLACTTLPRQKDELALIDLKVNVP